MRNAVEEMLNKAWWAGIKKKDMNDFEAIKNNLANFVPEEVEDFIPYVDHNLG